MSFEKAIFYFFSIMLVFAAFRVITVRNPVHAAFNLVWAFFTSAAIWMLMEAEFLAITLVLVYVGAVMVLFLFVVMMLDLNLAPVKEGFAQYLPVALPIAGLMVFEMMLVVLDQHFKSVAAPERHGADYSNTHELGRVLYTEYVYAFEIASVILLVAIIAAIALTMRKRPETRHQNPAEQVKVKRNDRLKVIKMDAES